MEFKGFCVVCGKHVVVLNPFKIKIRNKKSRNGGVEAHKGPCPDCKSSVYKIIGH